MGWDIWVEGAGALVLLAVLIPIVLLFLRRRWLSRQGGMVDCGLRMAGGSWSLGVARYNGEHLEWFPAFSAGFSPRIRLRRTATRVTETRDQAPGEARQLYAGQRIITLASTPDFGEPGEYELAMDAGSLTGLLSWLEAAPPSIDRFTA